MIFETPEKKDALMYFLLIKGYTVADLAKNAGIAYSYAYKIASGEKTPGSKTQNKIAEWLGISRRQIF